jgi:translation initiation factor 1
MGSNLVYSTDKGRIRKNSNKSDQKIISQTSKSSQTGNQHILLKRETKGRKGSGVTLIENLLLEPTEIKKLAKEIKSKCSSGGTIKEGIIEIQGDHRNKIKLLLEAKEFKVKLSGG